MFNLRESTLRELVGMKMLLVFVHAVAVATEDLWSLRSGLTLVLVSAQNQVKCLFMIT